MRKRSSPGAEFVPAAILPAVLSLPEPCQLFLEMEMQSWGRCRPGRVREPLPAADLVTAQQQARPCLSLLLLLLSFPFLSPGPAFLEQQESALPMLLKGPEPALAVTSG